MKIFNQLFRLTLLVLALTPIGCVQDQSAGLLEYVLMTRDSLKQIYAPDRRVARFDIEMDYANGQLIIEGESDQPEALEALLSALPEGGTKVLERVLILPDSSTRETPFAVVNNSVANLRSKPKHSAELATQATLGTVLKVLKITKEWYLVQTPDDYISWVDHGGVVLLTEKLLVDWQNDEKIIVNQINATVYGEANTEEVVSDLVLGNVLQKLDQSASDFRVRFPDGRIGILSRQSAIDYEQWLTNLNSSEELVEQYARQLMGVPYLWGGTSVKGMDCSGFTKTVYFMNGMVIPRDASQQVNAGEVVDDDLTFQGLAKGDLLFFGKPATDSTRQRTTHVGIWLGNNEFIHASRRVRISSIDPESPNYDEFNKKRYLGSRRYLDKPLGNIVDLTASLTSK